MSMDDGRKITAVIPVWKPDERFAAALERLQRQILPPDRILIINTEEEHFRPELIRNWENVSVLHIRKEMFDHGATRDMAAHMCDTPYLLFMTMDAVPADRHLTERLLAAFDDPETAAAYARQTAGKNCTTLERLVRSFNYPEESRRKTLADLPKLGVKTFFCSNVCAMYRRDIYLELGGFPDKTIFNEDMIFASKAIRAGKAVMYCADAKVIHYHNYTALQQFHRNFDIGVSQKQHPEVFEGIRSEKTGIRMIRETARKLALGGHFLSILQLVWQSGWKYAGFLMGKNYEKLPLRVILRLTSNRSYWETKSK